MDIVACADKNNIMPTGVMICSICVNNQDKEIAFHIIIDKDVSDMDCRELNEVITPFKNKNITIYHISAQILGNLFPNINTRIPRAAYFRLYLTELLPQTIEKVLYLDGDTIVRHSLDELWNADLSCFALAAVPDMRTGTIDRYNRLRYPSTMGYFNSGVLLINLKFWRDNQVLKVFTDYISSHRDDIFAHDQDVLNYVFRGLKKHLPIKYNFQHGYLWKEPLYDYWKYEKEVLEARKDPVILHFTSGNKPWVKYQPDPHPFCSSFYKYQNMTKWKGVRIDNRSIKTRIRTFVGDILRWMKVRPTVKNDFIEIEPID